MNAILEPRGGFCLNTDADNSNKRDNLNVLAITAIQYETSINQRAHHLFPFLKSRCNLTLAYTRTPGSAKSFWKKLKIVLTYKTEIFEEAGDKRIVQISGFQPRSKFGVIGDILFTIGLVWSLRSNVGKYDICIAGTPWAGVAGVILKRWGRVEHLVYEDLDLFPEFMEDGLQKRFITSIENYAVRHCDLLVCVGQELAELRKSQFGKQAIVVPNGVDLELFRQADLNVKHPPTLIYMGTLEEWCGAEIPLQALPELCRVYPDIRYLILGKDEEQYAAYLKKLVSDLEMQDHVKFLGHCDYQELPRYLAEADIGIATFKPSQLMKYAFTLKIVEYFSAGLFVIGTAIGETARILANIETAKAIGFNSDEFLEAALMMLKMREDAVLRRKSVEAAQGYGWDQLLETEWLEIQESYELRKGKQASSRDDEFER